MFENEHMNNVLFDTNLLLYSIDEDSKYFNSVQKLLTHLTHKNNILCGLCAFVAISA